MGPICRSATLPISPFSQFTHIFYFLLAALQLCGRNTLKSRTMETNRHRESHQSTTHMDTFVHTHIFTHQLELYCAVTQRTGSHISINQDSERHLRAPPTPLFLRGILEFIYRAVLSSYRLTDLGHRITTYWRRRNSLNTDHVQAWEVRTIDVAQDRNRSIAQSLSFSFIVLSVPAFYR